MDNDALERKKKHVAEEYLSSLSDLQCNSKPLINVLTMLAEENIELAPVIVKVVEQHIIKVSTELKLPILYLIDSIVKNVKNSYVTLFGQCIVSIFCHVFEKVNEKTRERMYALRQTWSEVFPASKLYSLDTRVRQMDKNWPITAIKPQPTAIHVNPNFLKTVPPTEIGDVLKAKTRELLELRKRKLELELEATKKHLEEQEKTSTEMAPVSDDKTLDSSLLPSTSTQMQAIASAEHSPSMTLNQNYLRPTMRMPLPAGQHNMMPTGAQLNPGAVGMASNINKVKVHPVNPALLNSIRQRDPRLMRKQMQQQQQPQQPQIMPNLSTAATNEAMPLQIHARNAIPATNEKSKREKRDSSRTRKSPNRNHISAEVTKSTTRHTSSQDRATSRSNKSSSSTSSNRERERERERKRGGSETKSYHSSSSIERRHQKNRDKQSKSGKAGSPLSYRDSKSPNSSPTKSKETTARRGNSNKTISSTKNGQIRRSSSPLENIVSSTKDIDLRALTIAADSSNHVAETITSSSTSAAALTTTPVVTAATSTEPRKIFSSLPTSTDGPAAVKGLVQNIKKEFVELAAAKMGATGTQSTPAKIEDEDLRQLLPSVLLNAAGNVPLTTMPAMSQVLTEPLAKSIVRKSVLDKKQATLNLDASSSSIKSPTTPNQSTKVSFKIQKLFNKLAKSTENSASVTTSTSLTAAISASGSKTISGELRKDLEDNDNLMDIDADINCEHVNKESGARSTGKSNSTGQGKKRTSETGVVDEPNAKKSKSAKLDALFGSEDVDLRTLAPMPIVATNEVLVAPPPPIISSSDDDQKEENIKKYDKEKLSKSSTSPAANTVNTTAGSGQIKAAASFEDVRAKFAKATKFDRLSKPERTADKSCFKPAEVNVNDDESTQEANEEKIRIILSQAQEMLDSNSINKEQYKQLVQTVISINEKNKLKEAKRRESLQPQQQSASSKSSKRDTRSEPPIVIEDGDASVDVELMAARDAVLRKRIPKLIKKAVNANALEEQHTLTKSPIAIDEDDERDNSVPNLNRLKPKEKRLRRSKWTNETNVNNTSGQGNANTTLQRPWQGGNVPNEPKRNNVGMRTAVPPPPQPPIQPLMLVAPNSLPLANNWANPPTNAPPISFTPNSTSLPIVRSSVPPPPQPPMNLPPVLPAISPNNLPKPCNSIDNPKADLVRTIHIDGQSKDIRIYDEVAIVFMDGDVPREIGFQPGQRAIIIDNQEPFTLRFNDEYKPLMIAGHMHRLRFGFPSRELYIDEHWYEIYFGGPPVSIPIQNKVHVLKAEGPPPQVTIGPVRRDLVVGRITMIVEAIHIFTLFLDARVQSFHYKNEEHTVQFADNLLTLLLDGKPQQVEYGGLPKPFILKGGKRYFIRFTTLPEGVVPGKVFIKDMIYVKTKPPTEMKPLASSEVDVNTTKEIPVEEPNKTEGDPKAETMADAASNNVPSAASLLNKINIDELLQKLVSTGILNNNVSKLKTLAAPVTTSNETSDQTEITTTITTDTDSKVEVEELDVREEEKLSPIVPIDLSKPSSIKTRQEAIVASLYSGMQCSSCGVRFPPEQTIKYSQHLDWHFRQNRRERDSTRKAQSRKWYLPLNEWLQYEEIEDLDEREKNFFETQQCELEALDDISNQRSTNSPQPTCPAGPDDVDRKCDMCHEKFEQFYNEELEEWHLRQAVRLEDKIYHPLCYEDHKSSLNPPADTETPAKTTSSDDVIMQENDNAVDVVIKIEEDENGYDVDPKIVADDEDDDVIVLPNEEPSVTEIDDDDEEYVPVNVTREEMRVGQDEQGNDETAMESDVEIQEPHIPFTDLDTYVEKELPYDESTQSSFKNVKIKEEPREDDEDDDFEDVGTVMYGPNDEISLQSSEETQTHTIISSVDSPATISGDPSPATNMFSSVQTTDSTTIGTTNTTHNERNADDGNNISIDGNLEPSDGLHNLSFSGPPPAVPLGSLVNKIKINITKSSATAAQSAAAVLSTETTTTTTSSNLSSTNNNNEAFNQNSSNTHVISTIPVLCGGGTMLAPTALNTTPVSCMSSSGNSQVSNITVIGSYGSSYQQSSTLTTTNTPAPQKQQRSPTPPVEETITFDFKPALQKAKLKKMKKIDCGIETSGLCSIM